MGLWRVKLELLVEANNRREAWEEADAIAEGIDANVYSIPEQPEEQREG